MQLKGEQRGEDDDEGDYSFDNPRYAFMVHTVFFIRDVGFFQLVLSLIFFGNLTSLIPCTIP